MAGKSKPLSDSVLESLPADTYEHFRYHKLFCNGIDSAKKEEVNKYLIKEYLGGKSPEEFVLTHINESILKDMSKFTVKKKETAAAGETK